MSNVTHTTLSHINTLVVAAVSYEAALQVVRTDYQAGKLSRDTAKIALATAYVHHCHKLADQRDAETGKALRNSALEKRVNRMLSDITGADKMSAKDEIRDTIVLTPEQLRLLAALDATFDTYSNMRKGIASYIATASAQQ